jgi:hypothetical protein
VIAGKQFNIFGTGHGSGGLEHVIFFTGMKKNGNDTCLAAFY